MDISPGMSEDFFTSYEVLYTLLIYSIKNNAFVYLEPFKSVFMPQFIHFLHLALNVLPPMEQAAGNSRIWKNFKNCIQGRFFEIRF